MPAVTAMKRMSMLAQNVSGECMNFRMGPSFRDIDVIRSGDRLGMERRQAWQIRDLARGQFHGLGPAIARRPVAVNIGAVRTGAKSVTPGLAPLPTTSTEDMRELLHDTTHSEPKLRRTE